MYEEYCNLWFRTWWLAQHAWIWSSEGEVREMGWRKSDWTPTLYPLDQNPTPNAEGAVTHGCSDGRQPIAT